MTSALVLWLLLLHGKQTAACWQKCWSQGYKVCDLAGDPHKNY